VRVLFDTNVLLDVLLRREPHAVVAAQLLSQADAGVLDGVLCADALTTVDYIAARIVGARESRRMIDELLRICSVVPVDRAVLERALRLDVPDFEDAVVHEAARAGGAAAIVTRDAAGFSRATVPVIDPLELLSSLAVVEADGPA
jgi:predicted nucleic acid-binding protein